MLETVATFCGAAVVLVYGWWATSLEHFTWPSRLAIVLPGLVLLVVAGKRTPHRRRQRSPGRERFGTAVWGLLGVLVVVWELFNYCHAGRSEYPTLSSLV